MCLEFRRVLFRSNNLNGKIIYTKVNGKKLMKYCQKLATSLNLQDASALPFVKKAVY